MFACAARINKWPLRPLKNAERNLNECIGAAGGKEASAAVVTWMRAHADIFGVGRVPRSEIIARSPD
jgi:hypothetical protein